MNNYENLINATILEINQDSDTGMTIVTSEGEIHISIDHSNSELGINYDEPFLEIDLYDTEGNSI